MLLFIASAKDFRVRTNTVPVKTNGYMMKITKIPSVLKFSGQSRIQGSCPEVPKYNKLSRIKVVFIKKYGK